MSALLDVRSLSVSYGGLMAVDDVDISVPEAAVVGLIGPNGAGKTSCIDALTGFAPAGGRVLFGGERIDDLPPHLRARRGLVRTFQSVELFDDLCVRDNLVVAASRPRWWSPLADALRPRRRGAAVDVEWALDAVGLGGSGDVFPGELSHGRRRLVGLARALAARPRLVLLDEPAAGLDTSETVALGDQLRKLPDLGVAVLLIDHDMGLVMSACETVYVLDFGRIVACGPPTEIRSDPAVIAAYLGQHSDQQPHPDRRGLGTLEQRPEDAP